MLSDPTRLRTRRSNGYLVSWKHRLRIDGDEQATRLAERLLADPANVEALRASLGGDAISEENVASWVVGRLASGALRLLRIKVKAPVLDPPKVGDLVDLIPDPVVGPDPANVSTRFEICTTGPVTSTWTPLSRASFPSSIGTSGASASMASLT